MGARGRRPTIGAGPGRAKGMGTTRGRRVRCPVLARAAGLGPGRGPHDSTYSTQAASLEERLALLSTIHGPAG